MAFRTTANFAVFYNIFLIHLEFQSSPSSYIKITITIPYSDNKKFELRLVRDPPIGLLEGMRKERIRGFSDCKVLFKIQNPPPP